MANTHGFTSAPSFTMSDIWFTLWAWSGSSLELKTGTMTLTAKVVASHKCKESIHLYVSIFQVQKIAFGIRSNATHFKLLRSIKENFIPCVYRYFCLPWYSLFRRQPNKLKKMMFHPM